MSTIGSLSVIIQANAQGLISGLSRAMGSLTAFAGVARSATGTVAGFGVSATGVQGIMLGVGSAALSLGKHMVETAANFEVTEVAMTSMTGSAEKAKMLMDELTALSLRTPFQVQDMAKSAQGLLAYGFAAEQVTPLLERMGNLASASPFGMSESIQRMTIALGQMQGKQRVMTQEMNQLTESGATGIWEALAKRLGTDVRGAMHQVELGAVGAREGIMAMMDLAESPRFANTMSMRAKTLEGVFSTLKDNATLAMRDIGKVIIEGFDLKGTVMAASAFLADLRSKLDGLKPPLMMIGSLFGAMRDIGFAAASVVADALRDWGLSIDASAKRLFGLRSAAIDVFEAIAQAARRFAAVALNVVMDFIEIVQIGFGSMGTALSDMAAAFEASWIPSINAMAPAIIAAGTAFTGVAKGLDPLFDKIALLTWHLQNAEKATTGLFNRARAGQLQPLVSVMNQIGQTVKGVRAAFAGGGEGGALQGLGVGLLGALGIAQNMGLVKAAPGKFEMDMAGAKVAIAGPQFARADMRGSVEAASANAQRLYGMGDNRTNLPQERMVKQQEKSNKTLEAMEKHMRQIAEAEKIKILER